MKKTILIIDDEMICLKTAENILMQKYNVICVDSGEIGLDIMLHHQVDLVLLDIMMPDMDGMEVIRRIRNNEKLASTPIIIYTASDYEGDITEAKRLGISGVVHKPIFPDDVFNKVKNALPEKEKDFILVVDDEPINLELTTRMLGDIYEVGCVTSGKQALEKITKRVPDLILLDFHMPEMNGIEVMNRIRQMPGMDNVPIVFLTADDNPKIEVEILKRGAMDFIRKPFVAEVVQYRIGRILELNRLQQSLSVEVEKKTKQIDETNHRIINLTSQVMLALSGTIDAKDHYTNGHSVRVAEYSRELARRMGKSAQFMNDIFYIALLHDIGKVGVPNEIINKVGKLTDEEYGIMKTHPGIGAQILDKITEMPELATGAHWHHERFDGRGYPDGLAGKEIPEIARIIGVADAYDAMTSKRSYRDVLSQEKVRGEIERGRGTQFDPDIADIMLQIMDEDKEYKLKEN